VWDVARCVAIFPNRHTTSPVVTRNASLGPDRSSVTNYIRALIHFQMARAYFTKLINAEIVDIHPVKSARELAISVCWELDR
jgi:hypothetical protein